MNDLTKSLIKSISITDIATRLGIEVTNNKALCFNHDEKTPSLSFKDRDCIFKCFGCGISGDNIDLVMVYFDCDFLEACKWICDEFNITFQHNHSISNIKKTRIQKPTKIKQNTVINSGDKYSYIYDWLLSKTRYVSSSLAMKYLNEHAISTTTAYNLGVRELVDIDRAYNALKNNFDNDELIKSGIFSLTKFGIKLLWSRATLLFPIYDNKQEHAIYIQGRQLAGKIKYLNLKGIETPIFNSSILPQLNKGDEIIICEGIPDTLALIGKGYNAIGILGSNSFKSHWVDELLNYSIFVLPDADPGGEIFTMHLKRLFSERAKTIKTISLPPGYDIASYISKGTHE